MTRRLAPLAAALWIALPAAAGALTPGEERGRAIYRRGAAVGADAWTATVGPDGAPLPATSFPCASCHGSWGEGGREGGLEAPALSWPRLSAHAVSPATGRVRGPYTDETLRRAITNGVGPSGAPLHVGMPRYRTTPARLTELIAYLKRIGDDSDTDPGVTDRSIRVGAALPLSGGLAPVGRSVRAVVEGVFETVNAGGGVYGRRLELVVEDSRGEPGGADDATGRLIDGGRVFALVGSFGPAASAHARRARAAEQIPLIGPVTISPSERTMPDPLVFYLLPSVYDQTRALVDFLVARRPAPPPRLAVVYAENDVDVEARAGVGTQADVHALEIVAEERFPSGPREAGDLVAKLVPTKPDVVLFFGDASGLVRLAQAMVRSGLNAELLSCVVMSGAGASRLPPEVAARAFFASPTAPPQGPAGADFFALLRRSPFPRQHLGVQTAAFAAAKVFVEGLRLGGKRLSRGGLVSALERLQNLNTGVTAPVSFRANRHVGTAGAAIMAVDPQRGELITVHRWISPKDPP